MTKDMRYQRSAYVMARLRVIEAMADRLQSAPLEVRRLGLPLAVAGWDRESKPELVRLVAEWLFGDWGMLPGRPVPQTAVALLGSLFEMDKANRGVMSVAEHEAEAVLQAAKVLAGAATTRTGGGRGA